MRRGQASLGNLRDASAILQKTVQDLETARQERSDLQIAIEAIRKKLVKVRKEGRKAGIRQKLLHSKS
jgi:hypothetical protein